MPMSALGPAFSCPSRRPRRAASSRPLAANRRTTLIAADLSQLAWFSSRCVRSGIRSRPCRAILHPFIRSNSLTSVDTYSPPAAMNLSWQNTAAAAPAAHPVSAAPARRLS